VAFTVTLSSCKDPHQSCNPASTSFAQPVGKTEMGLPRRAGACGVLALWGPIHIAACRWTCAQPMHMQNRGPPTNTTVVRTWVASHVAWRLFCFQRLLLQSYVYGCPYGQLLRCLSCIQTDTAASCCPVDTPRVSAAPSAPSYRQFWGRQTTLLLGDALCFHDSAYSCSH